MADTSTFCVLPWIHLATHPHGSTSLCCRVVFENGLGMARNWNEKNEQSFPTLNETSVQDMMNTMSFKEARQEMLKGKKPKACADCFKAEALNIESKRQRENKIFNFTEEQAKSETAADGSIDVNLRFIELRLGNLCNLKCRTCNPASSTKWKTDYDALMKQLPFLRNYSDDLDFSWPDKQEFWDELLKRSTNLEMIYINGGEPTLIQKHWDFIGGLVASGRSKSIALTYNTNMTNMPEKAFGFWKEFKSVHIGASVEDVGSRNKYIRHPTEWETVKKNMLRVKAEGFSIGITQTVSAYNFYYLDELYQWGKENGIDVGHNYVYDPDFLSPMAMPENLRKLCLEKLKRGLPNDMQSALVASFAGAARPELWERFFEYTNALDKVRKESFAETFPEYFELIKSIGGVK